MVGVEATISDRPLGVARPDLVLSFVPGPLVLAAGLGVLFGVPLWLALAVGSVPASLAVGYVLFYRPPGSHGHVTGSESGSANRPDSGKR